jgi:hypothetical protein
LRFFNGFLLYFKFKLCFFTQTQVGVISQKTVFNDLTLHLLIVEGWLMLF